MAVHVNEDGTLRNLTISLNSADDDNFSISGIKRLINNKNLASMLYVSNCDPSDYEYIIFIIYNAQSGGANYFSITTHILKGSWIQNATSSSTYIYLMITRTEISSAARPNHYLLVQYDLSNNFIGLTVGPSAGSWYNIDILGILK